MTTNHDSQAALEEPRSAPPASASGCPSDDPELDLAREVLYRFLAVALSSPRHGGARELEDPGNRRVVQDAATLLRDVGETNGELAINELPPDALSPERVFDRWDQVIGDREAWDAAHARVFGFIACTDCPPCETEYYEQGEAFFRAQQMADIAGFYRAFGLAVSSQAPQRPDHAAVELEFLAFLLMKKRLACQEHDREAGALHADVCADAHAKFLRDHAVWWMPAFTRLLRAKDPDGFYGAVGCVLASFVAIERALAGIEIPRRRAQPAETIEPDDGCGGCAPDLVQISS